MPWNNVRAAQRNNGTGRAALRRASAAPRPLAELRIPLALARSPQLLQRRPVRRDPGALRLQQCAPRLEQSPSRASVVLRPQVGGEQFGAFPQDDAPGARGGGGAQRGVFFCAPGAGLGHQGAHGRLQLHSDCAPGLGRARGNPSPAQPSPAQPSSAQPCTAQHSTAQHSTAQPNPTQPSQPTRLRRNPCPSQAWDAARGPAVDFLPILPRPLSPSLPVQCCASRKTLHGLDRPGIKPGQHSPAAPLRPASLPAPAAASLPVRCAALERCRGAPPSRRTRREKKLCCCDCAAYSQTPTR